MAAHRSRKCKWKKISRGHRLLARLEVNDPEALRSGRASFPQKMYLEMLLPKAEPVIHLNFSWFQKPATRLPEALWLSFHPIAPDPAGWTLEKSGAAGISLGCGRIRQSSYARTLERIRLQG